MANPKKDKKQAAVEEPDPNNVEDIVQGVVAAAAAETTDEATLQKKRRMCRFPGCTKVIKSQGHCQRHGARAKRCKVEGCEKQAQGTHDGMCKRHWKAVHFPHQAAAAHASKDSAAAAAAAPQPEGDSVYDSILPASISFRPPNKKVDVVMEEEVFADGKIDPLDPPSAPEGAPVMPLVAFLQEGRDKEAGWHRTAERRARGMFRTQSLTSQLEPWERQLALCEILLLSGGTAYANFKDLAHAWGREKGFHHLLATSVCERRGEVERKRRSDYGRTLSDAEKAVRGKKPRVEEAKVEAVAEGESIGI